jgi:hypothetical protein
MNRGVLAIVSVAVLAGAIGAHIVPKSLAWTRGSAFQVVPPNVAYTRRGRRAPETFRTGHQSEQFARVDMAALSKRAAQTIAATGLLF